MQWSHAYPILLLQRRCRTNWSDPVPAVPASCGVGALRCDGLRPYDVRRRPVARRPRPCYPSRFRSDSAREGMMASARPVDMAKLEAFMGKMVGDMGAAMSGALVIVGAKLGLYRALHEGGAMTPQALADATGTTERYVREWLSAQAASGFVDYDADGGTFSLVARAGDGARRRGFAGLCRQRLRADRLGLYRRAEDHRGVPDRQGRRLARASRMPVPGHGEVLPPRLSRQSGPGLAAGAGRRGRAAERRRRRSPTSAAAPAPRP